MSFESDSQQIFPVGTGLGASATLDLKTKLWGKARDRRANSRRATQRLAAARARQAPQAHNLARGPRNSRD
jgi:hypothetical protein